MNTNNHTQKIILAVAILLIIFFIIFKTKNTETVNLEALPITEESAASSTVEILDKESNTTNQVLGQNLSASDKAWATFEKYTDYARKHDIEGVKSLAHKFTGTCSKASESAEMQKKCFDILDSVYKMGTTMQKSSYKNTLSDSKQIILSSEIKETDTGDNIELSKNLIYFTIGSNGTAKILGVENDRTISVKKYGLSQDELAKSLRENKLDSDSDGLEDKMETCSLNSSNKNCIQTDPNKKDTDGDGFWDSLEPLL